MKVDLLAWDREAGSCPLFHGEGVLGQLISAFSLYIAMHVNGALFRLHEVHPFVASMHHVSPRGFFFRANVLVWMACNDRKRTLFFSILVIPATAIAPATGSNCSLTSSVSVSFPLLGTPGCFAVCGDGSSIGFHTEPLHIHRNFIHAFFPTRTATCCKCPPSTCKEVPM